MALETVDQTLLHLVFVLGMNLLSTLGLLVIAGNLLTAAHMLHDLEREWVAELRRLRSGHDHGDAAPDPGARSVGDGE